MATFTGCIYGLLPFSYLGFPLGANMKRIDYWKVLVDRFRKRLSVWNASLLSIGGRLTLIKSVLACELHLFGGGTQAKRKLPWDQVIASKDHGGLEIGSLNAFNLALLHKWKWR
ncbi:uncharacterized protein [Rutidosis leptorrhynchoides]|uniref:uncharacterized protein n=1 Tax=Rutidosis leptorrhynchoides TaxID=125765 RepID=UPI003A999D49